EQRRSPLGTVVAMRPAPLPQLHRESGAAEYGYEVMYLLDETDDARVAVLRSELTGLGDCVAIVGSGAASGDGAAALWNVHVHCSAVGAAIEAGVRAGRPHRITVLRFADQVGPERTCSTPAGPDPAGPDRVVGGRAVLAMACGAGVTELLRAEGVAT